MGGTAAYAAELWAESPEAVDEQIDANFTRRGGWQRSVRTASAGLWDGVRFGALAHAGVLGGLRNASGPSSNSLDSVEFPRFTGLSGGVDPEPDPPP